MTNKEIKIVNELIKTKTEACNSSVYSSDDWMYFCGAAQGIEEVMIELGYEWNGAEFVEARYD